MESWVQLLPAHGYTFPRTIKVRGLVQSIVSTSDARDWTYGAHEGSGQERALAGRSGIDTGGRTSRGVTNSFHASVKASRPGMGLANGRPPAAHILHHVQQAKLGDVQVHEEAAAVHGREEVGGILLHRLRLLVANEGGVAKLRGLGPMGPGQGR